MAVMNDILRRFPLEGRPQSVTALSGGHINRSFLVTTDTSRRYVLQRVNRHVFHDVDAIMQNLSLLRDYLRGSRDAPPMISFIDALDGSRGVWDGEGEFWRLCDYVDGSVSLLRPDSVEDLYQSALAFGRFQYALRDFPAQLLRETIPRFHDTPRRYDQLKEVMEADRLGRGEKTAKELDFALERRSGAARLQLLRDSGELPLRVTHNDTKLSNVLLDFRTRRAKCVIDLDTVMPGLAAYDFGDGIRSGASAAAEDGREARLDLRYYESFVRGFLEACPHLSPCERETLPLGAWTMTLECGVRFLTDYLDGDRYFAVTDPEQNLRRARAQFSLLADMERHKNEMIALTK